MAIRTVRMTVKMTKVGPMFSFGGSGSVGVVVAIVGVLAGRISAAQDTPDRSRWVGHNWSSPTGEGLGQKLNNIDEGEIAQSLNWGCRCDYMSRHVGADAKRVMVGLTSPFSMVRPRQEARKSDRGQGFPGETGPMLGGPCKYVLADFSLVQTGSLP